MADPTVCFVQHSNSNYLYVLFQKALFLQEKLAAIPFHFCTMQQDISLYF